jgi:hypothetical protein
MDYVQEFRIKDFTVILHFESEINCIQCRTINSLQHNTKASGLMVMLRMPIDALRNNGDLFYSNE